MNNNARLQRMKNNGPSPLPPGIPQHTEIKITIDNITGKVTMDFNFPIPALQMINVCTQIIKAQVDTMLAQAVKAPVQRPICFECRRGNHSHNGKEKGESCGTRIPTWNEDQSLRNPSESPSCECVEVGPHAP